MKILIIALLALALQGCTDPVGLAKALQGSTATDCITVTAPWGTIVAAHVNQNSTTVDGCKIAQGINVAPVQPTIIMVPSAPGTAVQVIRP